MCGAFITAYEMPNQLSRSIGDAPYINKSKNVQPHYLIEHNFSALDSPPGLGEPVVRVAGRGREVVPATNNVDCRVDCILRLRSSSRGAHKAIRPVESLPEQRIPSLPLGICLRYTTETPVRMHSDI
eukprot:scaffold245824_cov33-Tisochrysis_lutea.AAC.3